MAKLNFPDPNSVQTYTRAGITWTWNPDLEVWSQDTVVKDADDRYLRKDSTAGLQTVASAARVTFNGPVTTKGHVTLPGGGGLNAAVRRDEVESMIQGLAPDVPGVGDITAVNAGDGLEGGGTMGAVTLGVDDTVVRTSGNQDISGGKTFTNRTTNENGIDVTGGQVTLPGGGGDTQALQKQEIETLIEDNTKLSVRSYGAKGDGTTNDWAAINAMANDVGYVLFTRGVYRITGNRSIRVPLYFEEEARILVGGSDKIRIWNRISASPKQQIFDYVGGPTAPTGSIVLQNDNAEGIGEDSRYVYAAWYGIFAVGQQGPSQSPLFEKAMESLDEDIREAVFELDVATYYIDRGLDIPKSVWFKGQGDRRTVFDIAHDSGYCFKLTGSGCRMTDLKFEMRSQGFGGSGDRYFDGSLIIADASRCHIERIGVFCCKVGVELTEEAAYTVVDGIHGGYNVLPDTPNVIDNIQTYPNDSAMVLVNAAFANVTRCYCGYNNYAARYTVLVGVGARSSHTILGVNIDGIRNDKGIPVGVISRCAIQNITISNVIFTARGFSSLKFVPCAVFLECFGDNSIYGVSINNVSSFGSETNVRIEGRTTSKVSRVSISGCHSPNNDTQIIYVENKTHTDGNPSVNNVSVSNSCVSTHPVPLSYTGPDPFSYKPSHYSTFEVDEAGTVLSEQPSLLDRVQAIEANQILDNAGDNALLTLVAELSNRVTALEGGTN